jgi:hypothetical protein
MATRRARNHAKRTTRRAGAGAAVSVEGLRAAFDKVDIKARSAIEAGKSDAAVADAIDKSWTNLFHHGLSTTALKGLTMHYRALYRSRKTRKNKQRGGMAPMDWTLGQGTTAAVYGSFPVEMGATARTVGALDLDRYFENSISRSCDGTGYAPPKQAGGGIIDGILAPHAMPSAPRNFAETGLNNLVGAPHHYSVAAPEIRAWNYTNFTPQPFNPTSISSISSLAPVYTA